MSDVDETARKSLACRPGARAIALRTFPIGATGDALARMSQPPPNCFTLSNEPTNEPDVVAPTTSVNTTSVNITSVTPVRKRFRSGYAIAILSTGASPRILRVAKERPDRSTSALLMISQDGAEHDEETAGDPHREAHREVAAGRPTHPRERHQPEGDEAGSGQGVRDALREARDPEDRDEPEEDQRDAEPDGQRLRARDAGDEQDCSEHHRDEPEQPVAPARAVRRLGQVPDRADDVQPADAPGGDGDDERGQKHAERVPDDDAPQAHVVLNRQAHVSERAAEHEDHPEGDHDPHGGADGCGRDVVRDALVDEHLHEVAASRPDGSRDAELTSPL